MPATGWTGGSATDSKLARGPDRKRIRRWGSLKAVPTEPLLVQAVVRASFLDLQQRFIHWFSIAAVGGKDDAVVFFVKDGSGRLDLAVSFVRGVVQQDWRIVDDCVHLASLQRLQRLLDFGKL